MTSCTFTSGGSPLLLAPEIIRISFGVFIDSGKSHLSSNRSLLPTIEISTVTLLPSTLKPKIRLT